MKFPFLLLSFVLLASLQAQDADGRRISRGDKLPNFLQQFDANENGQIDEEERQAKRDLLRKFREERRNSIDTNDDGIISQDEIRAARNSIRRRIEDRRLERFNEIAAGDEVLSFEEFLSIPGFEELEEEIAEAIFARLDTDESGDISAEEFLQRLRPHRPEREQATSAAKSRRAALQKREPVIRDQSRLQFNQPLFWFSGNSDNTTTDLYRQLLQGNRAWK